jgi:hypothetical protein
MQRADDFIEEIVERSRQNTEAVVSLVQAQVREQLGALGLATKDDIARLEAKINSATRAGGTKSTAAKKSTARKSTAKKTAARKSTAKKSAAKKSTARKSTAKKSTAKKTAARKSTAAKKR